jgi:hypothetical protein
MNLAVDSTEAGLAIMGFEDVPVFADLRCWMGSVANLKFRARETVRPRHQTTAVRPKSPATNAICPMMSSFSNYLTCLCLQKMLIMRPERRSETRSNVIEEVRNLHWQEIDP